MKHVGLNRSGDFDQMTMNGLGQNDQGDFDQLSLAGVDFGEDYCKDMGVLPNNLEGEYQMNGYHNQMGTLPEGLSGDFDQLGMVPEGLSGYHNQMGTLPSGLGHSMHNQMGHIPGGLGQFNPMTWFNSQPMHMKVIVGVGAGLAAYMAAKQFGLIPKSTKLPVLGL